MISISTFTLSIVFPKELFIKGFNGRIAHGAFLQYLRKHDLLLSQDLHEGNSKRTYSLSPIKFEKMADNWVGKLSIHTVDERIIKSLLSLIMENKYGEIYIVDTKCQVIRIDFSRKEISPLREINMASRINMKFISPTYFSNDHRKSKSDPYPHIGRIWLDIIKTYSMLVEEIKEVDRQLLVNIFTQQLSTPRFNLRSMQVSLSKHMKINCFMGYIQFHVEDNTNLELLIPMLECVSSWGIGGKRAMGFGRIQLDIKEVDKKTDNTHKKLLEIKVGGEENGNSNKN